MLVRHRRRAPRADTHRARGWCRWPRRRRRSGRQRRSKRRRPWATGRLREGRGGRGAGDWRGAERRGWRKQVATSDTARSLRARAASATTHPSRRRAGRWDQVVRLAVRGGGAGGESGEPHRAARAAEGCTRVQGARRVRARQRCSRQARARGDVRSPGSRRRAPFCRPAKSGRRVSMAPAAAAAEASHANRRTASPRPSPQTPPSARRSRATPAHPRRGRKVWRATPRTPSRRSRRIASPSAARCVTRSVAHRAAAAALADALRAGVDAIQGVRGAHQGRHHGR